MEQYLQRFERRSEIAKNPRKGRNMILEMKGFVGDSPSSSSSSPRQLQTQVDSPQSGQTPWYFPQLGAPMPDETRLDEGQFTGSFEVDPATLSVRASSTVQSCSTDPDGQVAAVTGPSSRVLEPGMQSNSLLALPNFEGAVSVFNATGAAMKEMGQSLVNGPPSVWQGSVT